MCICVTKLDHRRVPFEIIIKKCFKYTMYCVIIKYRRRDISWFDDIGLIR